ncbi:hypothetical protein Tco_0469055 [Tanacetum coccineum]
MMAELLYNQFRGDKFLLLLVQVEPTLQEQVEAILGNKGLLFVTTANGKDTCPNSALNLRGNRMIHDSGIAEAKVALMANLSHYDSDALAEVHKPNVDTNIINQAMQAMPSSEQSNDVNHTETEITSDSNIISYSQNSHSSLVDTTKVEVPQELLKEPEFLIIIRQTCPSINNSSDKIVVVTPKNKDKRVRFIEPVTSSGKINIKTTSSSNLVSNKPMLSSTGVKSSNSASRSQPSGNTKKDKIQQTPSGTQKNKVEAHPRTVKSSLKNKNCFVEPKGNKNVQHSKLNANFELLCVKCNSCMLSDNHDLCVLDFINDMKARTKSKSVKKSSKRKVWKPTGKVFINIGYTWRPTGRTFTIVGNMCPLTRINTTVEVPLRKPTALESDTPKPVVTLVYSRKPRKSKTNVPVVQIVLWYLDSGCSKHMTGDRSQLTKFVNNFLGTVKFGNDHVAKILGYGDYQIGNVTISRVYYVEGLGHNLFSVGQFCD